MLVLQCIVVHVHSESELWALLPNLKKKKKKIAFPVQFVDNLSTKSYFLLRILK